MSQVTFKAPWGAIRGLQFGNVQSQHKVICLHGWQDNCGLFRPMCQTMDQSRHYLALDLMGHGLSDPLPRGLPYNFINYCYGIEYAMKEAQIEKFTLIGHSMGGNVAGLYASLFPEKINKLVLLDAAGMPFIRQDWRSHVRQSIEKTTKTDSQPARPNPAYSREALIERIQAAMGMINSSLSPSAIEAWFERGATQVEEGQFQINRDFRLGLPSPPIMGYDQMRELHQALIDADFDTLHLRPRDPEKFVGGFEDISKFRTQTEAFVSESIKKPGCKMDLIEGNHHFFINQYQPTAAAVDKFLSN